MGFFTGCDSGQVGIAETDAQRRTLKDTEHIPVASQPLVLINEEIEARPAFNEPVASAPHFERPTASGSFGVITPVSLEQSATARQWLDAVISRYQRADRYSDQGYVRLSYRRLREPHEDTAPLSVSFVRERALHLRAYAAEVVSLQGRFQAAITDPLTNNFDSQVIDRTLGASGLTLAELYSDPELAHFSSAGLGGPSPQLELLLSEKPLAGLFEGSAKVLLGKTQTLTQLDAGQTASPQRTSRTFNCQQLTIDSDSLAYHLWIDIDTGLLRRIELPSSAAGLDVDPSVSDVKLTIELEGAKFDVSANEQFQLPAERISDPQIKRVRSFVPLPPVMVSDLLGRRTPEFALSSADGNLVASERGSDRSITVLMWIADHPASRMAASQLQIVADARESAGKKDSRIVVVMAEPKLRGSATGVDTLVSPQSTSTTGALLRSWKVGLPYVDDFKAVGRDIFQIAEAPTLVVLGPTGVVEWVQPRVGPDIAVQLPLLLDDLAKRKEVGKEIRSRYEADQQTYKRLLAEAASR